MPVSRGTFWTRLVRGTRWTWLADRYRSALPPDWEATVMTRPADDRHHAKQGRSTGRVRFHSAEGTLSVYLKRHYELPWAARLGALVNPAGKHSPAAAEWVHLRQAQELGVRVPEAVAAGEQIGPWGSLRSFLMVAELKDCEAINEILPALADERAPAELAALKRRLAREIAAITARLHSTNHFHKDLYLCHFYLDMNTLATDAPHLYLIDLHRLGRHSVFAWRWQVKDLAQLLYSTFAVPQISDRDRLRFWRHYRRQVGLRRARWLAQVVVRKADRYRKHNDRP